MEEIEDSQLLDEYEVEIEDEDDCDIIDDVCEILTSVEVGQMMQKTVEDIAEILKLRRKHVRHLLNKYSWNEDKLMEDILNGERKEQDPKSEEGLDSCQISQCSICYALPLLDQQNSSSLSCSHTYHRTCWKQYLTIKIMDDGTGEKIECPGCDNLVDDDFIMDVIGDSYVQEKYWILVTNSFVLHHRQLRWCPGKECSRAIWMEIPAPRAVLCICGQISCFKCGKQGHGFVPCGIMDRWEKLMEQIPQEKKKEVKCCPVCRVLIEKNGGCNRMKCTQCGTKFNWCQVGSQDDQIKVFSQSNNFLNDSQIVKVTSGNTWKFRSFFSKAAECWGVLRHVSYKKDEPNKTFIMERIEDTKFESTRMKWESYSRSLGKAVLVDPKFINPKNILNEAKESIRKNLHPFFILEDLKSKLEAKAYAHFETEPIEAAINILGASQKTLMNMEVLGYFLTDPVEKASHDKERFLMMLFVDLEDAVHQLSLSVMNLEKDFLSSEFNSRKMEILEKSRYCNKKLNALSMLVRELVQSNALLFRN